MAILMIVEDEEDVREFAKRFFEKRNVKVISAGNAKEALEALKNIQPDLALFDINMEGMSGVELLKEIRRQGNDLKVIMVTGLEDEEVAKEAIQWGIKGYIHKPLILEELENVVFSELRIT